MVIMLKAILVDFDGTFVDSLPALWKCYRLFLSNHGIDGEREEFTSLMGPSIDQIVSLLKQKYQIKASAELLAKQYEDIVEAAYASQTIPFPWAIQVLKDQKAKGRRVAIVTAAYPLFVQKVLDCHGIVNLFDVIIGSQPGEPTKPDPAVYLRALHEFDIEAQNAIAIEDSQNGISSAVQAGIQTIAFTPDSIPISSFRSNNKLLQASSWLEISKLLANYDF